MIIEVNKMNKKNQIPSWPVEAKAGITLVLTSALIVGGALLLGKNIDNGVTPSNNNSIVSTNGVNNNPTSSPDNEVSLKVETLIKPFSVSATCKRYFYDLEDDASIRSQAIVPVPNKPSTYMKSVGVDYSYEGKTFDVIAATSGKVVTKMSDAIYGNMLVIKHESGLETIYASLGEMIVNEGDEVKQGDKISVSGQSLYTSTLGVSLHFEVMKNGEYLNPEKSYTLDVKKL